MGRDRRARNRVSVMLVSHSAAVAEGVAELVAQVTGDGVGILPVGGTSDGAIGTDGARVSTILRQASLGTGGVVVVMDFGSAVLNVRAALTALEADLHHRIIAVDAPLVEGALAAGMAAAQGLSLDEVADAAREARHVRKL